MAVTSAAPRLASFTQVPLRRASFKRASPKLRAVRGRLRRLVRSSAWLMAMMGLLGIRPALAGSEDGWAAYDAEHYADAVRLWQPEAEAGDAAAQFGLGIAYDLGRGVPASSIAACAWYSRAGGAGHVLAAFNTAVMYDSGRCGGPRRADLAALWYAKAAAAGHARAQFNIAQLYSSGDGVPRNPDVAAAWFRAAAANGITAAEGRDLPRSRTSSHRPLLPVAPVAADGSPPLAGGAAVLVWIAPAQPSRVRFFVELAALQADGPHEVLAEYVDQSAVQVRLPAGGNSYAWRVLTVGADSPHYAVAPWQRLEARP